MFGYARGLGLCLLVLVLGLELFLYFYALFSLGPIHETELS